MGGETPCAMNTCPGAFCAWARPGAGLLVGEQPLHAWVPGAKVMNWSPGGRLFLDCGMLLCIRSLEKCLVKYLLSI